MKILRWLWHTSRHFRLQATLNALIAILSVGLDFAFIAATKMAIDTATGRSERPLHLAAAILIAIIGSQITIGFARKWIVAILGVKAQNRMQHDLFSRLMQSQWTGQEKRHSGDTLNRLERDVRDVASVLTETLPQTLGVIARLVGAFLYLYSMDAMLACIVLVIVPLFALLSRIYVNRMRKLTRQIRQTDSRIQSILTESVQHRMVLLTHERTRTMAQKLASAQSMLQAQVRHRTLYSSSSATLLSAGFAIGYLVTFLWGAHRLQEGAITYGMMLAFIQLVGQIQNPFREMTRFVPILISSLTAAERLIELEDTPQEVEGAPLRFPTCAGIRLHDVSFAYDNRQRPVISHLTYTFPPGSITAILGETGAGKTTLFRLILALLKPDEGRIEIFTSHDASPVSPLTRCNMVYVPQGNTLFSGTLRENLLLGNPHATEEEMWKALSMACADFVLQQPEGLDTLCGEQGMGMSEGQAQRIAIARALLHHGSILLLDEASSALDTDTEQRLIHNLMAAHDGSQTIIFITHRPAIVQHCHNVLHLKREK